MKKIIAFFSVLIMLFSLCPMSLADGGYKVTVTDETGNPVMGAQAELCSDSTCFTQRTDENGEAKFDTVEPGEYKITLIKVPEGYMLPNEVKITSSDIANYSFVLKKEKIRRIYPEPENTYESLEDIDFSDYELVMVNYWEPWCSWCLKEMPDLQELYEKYKDDGLLVVGMYSDDYGAKTVLTDLEITYPTINYTEPSEYTTQGVPATVFYGRDGNILPQEDLELAEDYEKSISNQVKLYLEGAYDSYTDEDSMEYKKLLDDFSKDPSVLKAYALECARVDVANGLGAFLGYSEKDIWENRIKNRLG